MDSSAVSHPNDNFEASRGAIIYAIVSVIQAYRPSTCHFTSSASHLKVTLTPTYTSPQEHNCPIQSIFTVQLPR